jgi:hypothetical protein
MAKRKTTTRGASKRGKFKPGRSRGRGHKMTRLSVRKATRKE